jgi:hypothetical protein
VVRAVEVDDGGTALTIPGGGGWFLFPFLCKKKRTINKLAKTDHRRKKGFDMSPLRFPRLYPGV